MYAIININVVFLVKKKKSFLYQQFIDFSGEKFFFISGKID
jgi:hypothetical protein